MWYNCKNWALKIEWLTLIGYILVSEFEWQNYSTSKTLIWKLADENFVTKNNGGLWGGRIKGLKMQLFGKLNSTYHSKLRHCSSSTAAPQEKSRSKLDSYIAAAVHEWQYMREKKVCHVLRRLRSRHWCAAVWVLLHGPGCGVVIGRGWDENVHSM